MSKYVPPVLITAEPTHGKHSQKPEFEVGEMVLVEDPNRGHYHGIISEFLTYYDQACVSLTLEDGEEVMQPVGNISKY